jgi:hypothetical protein
MIDLGLGIGARCDVLGDLTNVAVNGRAHAGVIGADRAAHFHRFRNDVETRTAVDGRHADHGR